MFSFQEVFARSATTRIVVPDLSGEERPYTFSVDGDTDANPKALDKLLREQEAVAVSRKGKVDEHGLIHRPRSVESGEYWADAIGQLRKAIDEQKAKAKADEQAKANKPRRNGKAKSEPATPAATK